MCKTLLADKVQEEVATYVEAIAAKVDKGDGCLDLDRLTHLSIANNICSVMLGKRFDYEDVEFNEFVDSLDGYLKVGMA